MMCVHTTHPGKWFSDTTVKWVFSSISRDRNLENSVFTVTGLASKLTTGSSPPSYPQAYQPHSKGMSLLHPETEGHNSLNIDQTQDFSILQISLALTHPSSLGYLQGNQRFFLKRNGLFNHNNKKA